MTACKLSSVLLAAIVLCNCVTWTTSRHHYTHTASGHRSRHRRQGAGLYLSASYVIPGGEGVGWGEWGEVSSCSRTCGGGVASQKRICLRIGPDGQPQCSGGDTKYFSCETQDCPPDSPDFRAAQCAEFNDIDFRGVKYEWVPYTKGARPCELNCMPRGERFYYRHKQKVIDGTRCDDDSFDVCVDGQCQPVGCDMMLGSNAREDKCRECRGNGSNCYTNTGILDSQDYTMGYNDILFIPQGSTSIVIEEIAPSDNYLALRASKGGTYYLNGHYRIDFPRTLEIAGSLWTYDRSQQGFPAPDKLRSLGPTTEPLYLLLLQQSNNVGIRYEYSVPKSTSPPLDKKYHWVHDEFTPCSVSCGGGVQYRNVTCRSRQELEVVDDQLCDEGLKLASNQSCNPDPCPAQWVEQPWGECSKKCGEGGIRSREVECQKVISNGVATVVSDKECIETLGPKPKIFEECNRDTACPSWFVGAWKPCDRLCDEGNQTRQVVCHQKINGRVTILDDTDCEDEKPESQKTCMLEPCSGVDWITTAWTGCDSCLAKVQTRTALCVSVKLNDEEQARVTIINDTFCSYHTKPVTEEPCKEEKNCTYMWYATQWGNCSVKCGQGNRTRKVFCGLFDESSVQMVDDKDCAGLEKYPDTKPCTIPKEKCPAQWFKGPWGQCTKEVRRKQNRLVACLDSTGTGECNGEDILETTQLCNRTDEGTSAPDTEEEGDEEFCDEDDSDYEEEALDEEFILSTVLGDAPASTTIDDDTTSSSEDLEGSGFSETSDFFSSSFVTGVSSKAPASDDDSTEYEFVTTVNSSGSTEAAGTEVSFTSEGVTSDSTASAVSGSTTAPTSDETTLKGTETSTESGSTSSDKTTSSGSSDVTTTKPSDSTEVGTGSTSKDESLTVANTGSSDVTGSTPSITDSETTSSGEESKGPATSTESGSTSSDKTTSSGSSDVTSTKPSDSTEVGTGSTSKDESSTVANTGSSDVTGSTPSVTGSETTSSDKESKGTESSTVAGSDVTTELSGTKASTSSSSDVSGTSPLVEISTDITSEGTSGSTASDETEETVSDITESSTVSDFTEATESTETEDTTATDLSSVTDESNTTTSDETTSEGTTSSDTEVSRVSKLSTEAGVESTTLSVSDNTESSAVSTSVTESGATESKELTSEGSTSASDITTANSLATEEGTTSSNTEGSTISTKLASEKTTVEALETTTSEVENTTATGTESSVDSSVTGSSTESVSGETTVSGSTESSASGETTISGSTESSASGVTEESETTESTVESTGSTIAESESTTEAGTGSTESEGTTEENTGTTESSTDGSTEYETTSSGLSTESSFSTEEIVGSTTEGILIVSSQSTSDWFTSMRTKGKTCKRRKPKCLKTPFGCCPDMKTPASGPFDLNCTKPETCKETEFGCCPDGVSPAKGRNNKGCPIEPCEDTLFGCCLSDNKTAAEGNDQEGCPPPCVASKYGCCADNETEAIGPYKEGCPEAESTTTFAETETTGDTVSTEQTDISTSSSDSYSDTDSTTEYSTEETVTGSDVTDISDSTDSSTTSPIPCDESEFGCCYDNETAAAGPEGQGCPCNVTEFGCCTDGVSPAQGVNLEGCVDNCNTSAHGCCSDGNTPAHGPDGEGCCLSTAFGCCPDNRKPAEGPHLEGCGCENSAYGCCPDNVTIARGPDNDGCGCQYTKNGCCPDRHTEASGPNYEGCTCLTYQFGCCDDGVTIAKGPNKQGCDCQYSEFGCCGDKKTPATDNNGGGCDCSTSEFGCCPDGVTNAEGPKFLGCTGVPEDRQAACGLKADRGSCSNYTVMYFYDSEYGGCSRFWYGGCEGNGNRFTTKEECDDVCVNPPPKDVCKLPSIKGSCSGEYTRWAYNSSHEQCLPFRYGGCLGNANKFETRELCQAQCEPERSADQCSLPIEQGPCAGNFSHWGYNPGSQRCEQFIWGGCQGNANRFSTEVACQMRCDPPGALKPQCSEPQESGNCSSKLALWAFSQTENRCVPFYHSGCGGNGNRFDSRDACEQTCPSAYVPDKCTLPALPGECSNYRLKWFYDTSIKRCRQFYYGGCGGNQNNFETEAECDNSCSEERLYPPSTTTVRTPAPAPQPQGPVDVNEICLSGIDPGPCNSFVTRFAYDSSLGRCITFEYGGCGGNRNNFPDEHYCSYYCHPVQDVCQLPMLSGPCTESIMQWFYDPSSDSCSQFTYGGCEGNANRFDSQEACESRCRSPGVGTTTTTLAPTPAIDNRFLDLLPECRVSPSLEECRSPSVVWYLDAPRSECVQHVNQERGADCRYSGTFPTQEACERKCGVFRDVDVCKQRVDPGPCQEFVVKVFFDQDTSSCREFNYGGCQGGPNRFSTMEECSEICKPQAEEDPCSLPAEGGNCLEYAAMWYYDRVRDACGQFAYTGCGGNANRFATEEDCQARCRQPLVPPPPEPADECASPLSLTPCGDSIPVFYFNSKKQQCLTADIGSCNYANSYTTEEECQRRCGAFKGQDVCGAPLDPGPCRAAIPKYYWDVSTGSCQQFMYGGCQGGPNRFDNREECENVCGAYKTGPPAAPEPIPLKEPRVTVAEGDTVTLRCLFHGNPPPKITWRFGEITIDGNVGRYRLTSNGALEIVSVFRNDTGVYICVAENDLGTSTQEIFLNVGGSNEVADCSAYEQECAAIQCEGSIEQVATADGCRRCVCAAPCDSLLRECAVLNCPYGVRRVPEGNCERCVCVTSPCDDVRCPAGERCVTVAYQNPVDGRLQNGTECRQTNKYGLCPIDNEIGGINCTVECSDDADCRGDAKCCTKSCSQVCVPPELPGSTTHSPEVPAPPEAQPQQEPQVSAAEGGLATLRCLFHGNPPPRITWRRGELTIDGNVGRYRLTSDGSLEIVSVFRNDTGVYICVADNGLGTSKQEVHLVVNDPVVSDAGIAGDENAVVIGELDQPLEVKCLAYGHPEPSVYWYRSDGSLVPFNNVRFQARLNSLLIRRLDLDTLGEYTCQAYNGNGKAVSWTVAVQAYHPEGILLEHEYLVPRHPAPPAPGPPPPPPHTTRPTTTTTTTTEVPPPAFTVPVSAHISTPINTVNLGTEIRLVCEVDGYPDPQVFWAKDGERVVPNDRIVVSESEVFSRLSVSRVELSDSGVYTCHVANTYTRASDSVVMHVQQMVVPAKCTDNPYFARCDLIVRSNFCRHVYYSKFCCKSCVEAGQLDPQEAELQADQPLRRK